MRISGPLRRGGPVPGIRGSRAVVRDTRRAGRARRRRLPAGAGRAGAPRPARGPRHAPGGPHHARACGPAAARPREAAFPGSIVYPERTAGPARAAQAGSAAARLSSAEPISRLILMVHSSLSATCWRKPSIASRFADAHDSRAPRVAEQGAEPDREDRAAGPHRLDHALVPHRSRDQPGEVGRCVRFEWFHGDLADHGGQASKVEDTDRSVLFDPREVRRDRGPGSREAVEIRCGSAHELSVLSFDLGEVSADRPRRALPVRRVDARR